MIAVGQRNWETNVDFVPLAGRASQEAIGESVVDEPLICRVEGHVSVEPEGQLHSANAE